MSIPQHSSSCCFSVPQPLFGTSNLCTSLPPLSHRHGSPIWVKTFILVSFCLLHTKARTVHIQVEQYLSKNSYRFLTSTVVTFSWFSTSLLISDLHDETCKGSSWMMPCFFCLYFNLFCLKGRVIRLWREGEAERETFHLQMNTAARTRPG